MTPPPPFYYYFFKLTLFSVCLQTIASTDQDAGQRTEGRCAADEQAQLGCGPTLFRDVLLCLPHCPRDAQEWRRRQGQKRFQLYQQCI